MSRIRVSLLVACALAAAPLYAQPRADGGGPDARMRAFVQAARDYRPAEELADFFPRNGATTWVLTTKWLSGTSVGRWRFAPTDLVPAMSYPGPLCESFSHGGDVIPVHTLMYRMLYDSADWRRAGTRFVPPGEGPRSPTFVQWSREGGRWVISAFGEGRELLPRVLGDEGMGVRMVPDAVRGDPLVLPLPADAPYAGGMRWYDDNEPIEVAGHRLTKYGLPRPLGPGEVRRIGMVHGVGVYVEMGVVGAPEVVYVAVTPEGLFQPYQGMTGTGCP